MRKRLTFRHALLLSLVGAPALSAGIVGYVGQRHTTLVVTDAARGQVDQVARLAAAQTAEYVAPAERIGATVAATLASHGVAPGDDAGVERLLLTLLAGQPDVSGVEFGRPDGSFVFVRRAGLAFRTKLISVAGGTRTVVNVDRSAALVDLGRATDPDDTYDPRTRPWYQGAASRPDGGWTAPYVFFSTGRPGITQARMVSVDGANVGVVGVDVELSRLAMFVGALPVPGGGLAFVTDAAGSAIAVPGLDGPATRPDGTSLRLARLDELAGGTHAALAAAAVTGKVSAVRLGGEQRLVTAADLSIPGLDWRVVVHAPTRTITGPLAGVARRAQLAVAAAGVGSLFLAVPILVGLAGPARRLHRRATTDELTGLANRSRLYNVAGRVVADAVRRGEPLSIAVFDLDGFKTVNDTLGHPVGDEALREVSARFMAASRPGDHLGRLGGDEFVVVLDGAGAEAAHAACARICHAIADEAVPTSAGPVRLGATVGIAALGDRGLEHATTFETLLAVADRRMLAAKGPRRGPEANDTPPLTSTT